MFFMITFFFSLPSLYASSLSLNSICSRLRNICNYHDAADDDVDDGDDDDDDNVDDDDVITPETCRFVYQEERNQRALDR